LVGLACAVANLADLAVQRPARVAIVLRTILVLVTGTGYASVDDRIIVSPAAWLQLLSVRFSARRPVSALGARCRPPTA